jgi:hypothetical protein
MRISKHTIVTSKDNKDHFIVDAAAIGQRKMLLPGEILSQKVQEVSRSHSRQNWYEQEDKQRKSSELNYPDYPTPEMHAEGLNVKMFQIRQGSAAGQ